MSDLPSLENDEIELLESERQLIAARGQFSSEVIEAFSTGKYNNAEIKALKPVHQQMIDYMILHPEASHKDLCKVFQYESISLYRLKSTALFRAELARRRNEVFCEARDEISEKVDTLTNVTLDRLTERAAVETDAEILAKIANMALTAGGYISSKPSVAIQNNVVVVKPEQRETLAAARAASRQRFLPAPSNEKIEPASGTN